MLKEKIMTIMLRRYEIRVEGNQRRGRPKKKYMEIVRQNMMACAVDEYMIRDKKG